MDIVSYALAKKLVNGVQSGLASATVDNDNCSITFNWTNGTSSTLTFPKPADGVKGDKGDTGVSVQNVEIKKISGIRHLIVTLDDSTEIDAGILPNEQYDDTAIKADIKTNADNIATNTSDISDLQSDKQDKTDNSLDTTDKTVVGAINEVNGNSLDTVGFSADYKNIILNRKSGLNPCTIPISAIISNAKLTELGDVDNTDIGNGKTLVYDGTTSKHKYVDSAGTDELVKMEASTDAKYLSDLIDKSTIVNDNGTLKVKKLDGQDVTITEINYLKGLTMNVMDLVNMFSNGGVKIINTPVSTYADLLTYDKSALIDGVSYLIYVLADETHDGAKTTYLIDTATTTPTYFGYADSHRDFTTNPIDLANEVTGKLSTSNIDVDNLWTLLTINDTYKTLTTNNEVFGTHGAKALYDELITAIGKKANDDDLTTHTGDTSIHVSSTQTDKWDKVTDKVDKTDFDTHTGDTDIHITTSEREAWNNKANDNEVVKKTDIATSLDDIVTDEQVVSAKTIYGKLTSMDKECKIGYASGEFTTLSDYINSLGVDRTYFVRCTLDDAPVVEGVKQECVYVIVKYANEYIHVLAHNCLSSATWERSHVHGSWVENSWKRVCATSVADVDKTTINLNTMSNISFGNISAFYLISNGICTVDMTFNCTTTAPILWETAYNSLPIPKYVFHTSAPASGYDSAPLLINVNTNGTMEWYIGSAVTVNRTYYVNFSYPVSES